MAPERKVDPGRPAQWVLSADALVRFREIRRRPEFCGGAGPGQTGEESGHVLCRRFRAKLARRSERRQPAPASGRLCRRFRSDPPGRNSDDQGPAALERRGADPGSFQLEAVSGKYRSAFEARYSGFGRVSRCAGVGEVEHIPPAVRPARGLPVLPQAIGTFSRKDGRLGILE